MLSRALSLATVTLLIGCCTAGLARAQENLDAGKSPSQIFAGTCTACHKSPRGLLKTVAPGSLPGFLRQHYTTSPEMAGVLSSYLVSNGATDTRMGGGQAKESAKDGKGAKDGTKEAKSDARPEPRPEQLDRFGRRQRPAVPQEAAAPADEPKPAAESERPGRKRLARPADVPADAARPDVDGVPPAQTGEHADGRRSSAKQKLTKRGKPGVVEGAPKEPPKGEAIREEPAASGPPPSETAKVDTDRPEATKPEAASPDAIKPSNETPSQSATVEPPKDTGSPSLRPDPVPPVTPAPSASVAPSMSAASSGGGSESAGTSPATAAASPVTAAAPAPPPAPAGPPVPPISQ
jgi:hypothetical protein